jgi:hypothetical protein
MISESTRSVFKLKVAPAISFGGMSPILLHVVRRKTGPSHNGDGPATFLQNGQPADVRCSSSWSIVNVASFSPPNSCRLPRPASSTVAR